MTERKFIVTALSSNRSYDVIGRSCDIVASSQSCMFACGSKFTVHDTMTGETAGYIRKISDNNDNRLTLIRYNIDSEE